MEEPLISVIVPIYKVEKYLDRCVRSIVNQTHQNLEIILVDDGSPDNCPAMCDEWACRDCRIKVIHKPNGGLSDARNAGMAIATGEYMGFIDSDDYIAPEMYQALINRMMGDSSDIAACGVEMVYEDGTPSRLLTVNGQCVLCTQDALEAIISESWLKQPVWYKLYKSELIRDVPFPVGKYHEDVFWSYQAVASAARVSVFDTPYYFYVQRSGSIMGTSYSLHRLDAIEAKQNRLVFLRNHFPQLLPLGCKDLIFSCIYHGQAAQKGLSASDKARAKSYLNGIVKQCPLPDKSVMRSLSLTNKIWIYFAKINLSLTCSIRNLLGIGL